MMLILRQSVLTETVCLDKTGPVKETQRQTRTSHGQPSFVPRFVPTLLAALLLPSSWQDTAGRYLPMNAGDAIYTVRPEAHMLAPWTGFGMFCLYAAAALAAGFALIGRRDA